MSEDKEVVNTNYTVKDVFGREISVYASSWNDRCGSLDFFCDDKVVARFLSWESVRDDDYSSADGDS